MDYQPPYRPVGHFWRRSRQLTGAVDRVARTSIPAAVILGLAVSARRHPTYADAAYWHTHTRLLLGSLLWYLVPLVAIVPWMMSGSETAIQAFLFLA